MQESHFQAATLLEALPYIQKFNGATFVIKYGGSFMDSPDPAIRARCRPRCGLPRSSRAQSSRGPRRGEAITRAMEKAGLKATFVQGQRVTDERAVAVVDQVLSREINPEVVATINSLGGEAKGFAGTEIFTCRKLLANGPGGASFDLGYVGEVTSVNTAPLLECIGEGITPVISPTARSAEGHIYNCNADVAAAQVAIALAAKRLVFMSDVPGLLRDPNDASTVIPHLRADEVTELKRTGVIDKGMIPKVDSAVRAIQAGVEKVSFVDGRVPHAVLLEIFTDAGIGTEVVL
ncbi:MAG: acetylglutamate kinase [Verrucomicrobiota bacterium]